MVLGGLPQFIRCMPTRLDQSILCTLLPLNLMFHRNPLVLLILVENHGKWTSRRK
jgi:hypothetical protein